MPCSSCIACFRSLKLHWPSFWSFAMWALVLYGHKQNVVWAKKSSCTRDESIACRQDEGDQVTNQLSLPHSAERILEEALDSLQSNDRSSPGVYLNSSSPLIQQCQMLETINSIARFENNVSHLNISGVSWMHTTPDIWYISSSSDAILFCSHASNITTKFACRFAPQPSHTSSSTPLVEAQNQQLTNTDVILLNWDRPLVWQTALAALAWSLCRLSFIGKCNSLISFLIASLWGLPSILEYLLWKVLMYRTWCCGMILSSLRFFWVSWWHASCISLLQREATHSQLANLIKTIPHRGLTALAWPDQVM